MDQSRQYQKKVYTLPKQLDEKVARLHLEKIGVHLTSCNDKQSTYIRIPIMVRSIPPTGTNNQTADAAGSSPAAPR